jgi:hypothetical protein
MSITLPPPHYALKARDSRPSWRRLAAHRGNGHVVYVTKPPGLIQQTRLESASPEDIALPVRRRIWCPSARPLKLGTISAIGGAGGEGCSGVHGSGAKVLEKSYGSRRALGRQFVTVAGISRQWLGMARA